ncbi:MAG: MATE family efflux transporter [Clostridium sp.]|nr:MATE family efflux transporter [Clostridium sp.]
MSVNKQFAKYVSQNVLGMIAISIYILADTFFISKAVGSDGITALNLVLPIYSLIFAIGMMIGVGSVIRFTIERNQGNKEADKYFTNALFWGTAISLIFIILGGIWPEKVLELMGADADIVLVGTGYTRIFMIFAPFFIWNNICNAFVRNDNAPTVAMTATIVSSLFNIVADYILMFPLGMGIEGAALATAISPGIGVLVCLVHLLSKKCTIKIKIIIPSLKKLLYCCKLGVAAFVGEISSGVTIIVINMLILNLAGNTGVAAYGVVANISLVVVAVFNGVAQGSQPLISKFFGLKDIKNTKKVFKMSIITSFVLEIIIIIIIFVLNETIISIFNSENDVLMAQYAYTGIRMYFIGFIFAGINIVSIAALSSIEEAKLAFITSVMRGFVVIIICAIIMAYIWGMYGVWLSFCVAEGITFIAVINALHRTIFKNNRLE